MRFIEPRTASVLGVLAILGVAGTLVGCNSLEPVAPHEQPIVDPAKLYMRLTLDHPAVNLSTATGYNTLQLTATPRDALGNPMSGLPAPTFRMQALSDTTRVRVTPGGLLTAVGIGIGVKVIASVTLGPVTHADTAWINVSNLATPPVLDTLSIHPLQPDSTVWSLVSGFSSFAGTSSVSLTLLSNGLNPDPVVVTRTVDPAGTAISGLQVEYSSLDPAIANIDRRTGAVTLALPGQVRMVAQAMAYGMARADTVTFTVTPKIHGIVLWGRGFFLDGNGSPDGVPVPRLPQEIRIASYGVVGFVNYMATGGMGVTFDDPTNVVAPSGRLAVLCVSLSCDAGNVLLPGGGFFGTGQIRQFPVPGVYPYHYTQDGVNTGMMGRIVVSNTFE